MYNLNAKTGASASLTETQLPSVMSQRHSALAKKYRDAPQLAWITDLATTGQGNAKITDPLHANVLVAGVNIPLGLHTAVGGDHDAPVPGELLCASLAGCLDSTIRVIANRLSVKLTQLQVTVSAQIDVRGTLKFDPSIQVGFQKMHLSVDLQTAAGTKPELQAALLKAAEMSCVVLQTLKHPPVVSTQIQILKM